MTDAPTKPLSERFAEASYPAMFGIFFGRDGNTPDLLDEVLAALRLAESNPSAGAFKLGDLVHKKSGSSWRGKVVGFYATGLTPRGYCVESVYESGSVQLYSEAALVVGAFDAERPAAIREAVEGERSQAAADVLAERQRQVSAEGWTAEHDDEHKSGEMALAGACYAAHGTWASEDRSAGVAIPYGWPWSREWWKPKDRRRDLVRAGALIIAEIERLDRAAAIRARGEENR